MLFLLDDSLTSEKEVCSILEMEQAVGRQQVGRDRRKDLGDSADLL